MLNWLRRIAAVPLLVLALICAIGAVRIFTHDLPDETFGSGIFAAILAAAACVGAYFLFRSDLLVLRGLTFAQLRDWAYANPLGQAAALYGVAAIIMVASPEYQLAPAFLAMCVFSVMSCWTAASKQRWWAHAALAVLGFCLLFLGLAGTSEALARRGFGEGAMVFLLPLQGFPILLVVSGIVRLVRGARQE